MRQQIKQPFILTPETPYPQRKDRLDCWYPFWNAESVFCDFDFYLNWVLWKTEQDIAKGCNFADNIMASRAKFLYRTPNTPSEEMFCRGQF